MIVVSSDGIGSAQGGAAELKMMTSFRGEGPGPKAGIRALTVYAGHIGGLEVIDRIGSRK